MTFNISLYNCLITTTFRQQSQYTIINSIGIQYTSGNSLKKMTSHDSYVEKCW